MTANLRAQDMETYAVGEMKVDMRGYTAGRPIAVASILHICESG